MDHLRSLVPDPSVLDDNIRLDDSEMVAEANRVRSNNSEDLSREYRLVLWGFFISW
jgi:hypothetical protein